MWGAPDGRGALPPSTQRRGREFHRRRSGWPRPTPTPGFPNTGFRRSWRDMTPVPTSGRARSPSGTGRTGGAVPRPNGIAATRRSWSRLMGPAWASTDRFISAVGQFEHLATGEDRSFLRAVSAYGARCCFDRSAPVTTSARREARAPHGFSEALWRIEEPVRHGGSASAVDGVSA